MLLSAAGCASVSVQKFNKGVVYPPTDPASITVLPQKPSGNYTELGEITVRGANNWEQVEKIFQSKGAEMGANAVYVFSKQDEEKQYVSPDECYTYGGYYYPYQHFGWGGYHSRHYYPRGYYYCYGFQASTETVFFVSAVGIAIRSAPATQG